MGNDDSPFSKLGHMLPALAAMAAEKPFIPSIPRSPVYADTTYERLAAEVKAFEQGLAADEELGARLANLGQTVTIAVERIGFRNPFLIMFHGTTEPEGERCTLVQHMNQVSLLLVALKAKNPAKARRIGFQQDASDGVEVSEP